MVVNHPENFMSIRTWVQVAKVELHESCHAQVFVIRDLVASSRVGALVSCEELNKFNHTYKCGRWNVNAIWVNCTIESIIKRKYTLFRALRNAFESLKPFKVPLTWKLFLVFTPCFVTFFVNNL